MRVCTVRRSGCCESGGKRNRLQAVVEKLRSKEEQLLARKATDKRQWYINTQGQTFVILDAGEFLMGSPESEPGRRPDETQHRCRIGRRFAVSTTQVTKAQFARFQTAQPEIAKDEYGPMGQDGRFAADRHDLVRSGGITAIG